MSSDLLAEWKKKYEHMWDLHQSALQRIEELERSDKSIYILRANLRIRELELQVSQLTQKLEAKRKKQEKLIQKHKKQEEEFLLMQEQVKSLDTLKRLNIKLMNDYKYMETMKKQQDMVLLTQHELLKNAAEKLKELK